MGKSWVIKFDNSVGFKNMDKIKTNMYNLNIKMDPVGFKPTMLLSWRNSLSVKIRAHFYR